MNAMKMKELFTRRRIVIGAGGAAAALAAAGIVVEGSRLLRKRHAPSVYDDLLALLDDRDAAAQIGEAVLAGYDDFDARVIATDLREQIGHRPLAQVMAEDAAEGRVLEANGWVLPETLALLCALAAKAE